MFYSKNILKADVEIRFKPSEVFFRVDFLGKNKAGVL